MEPTPGERLNRLANCGDPEVEWLVDQFKEVVRTLYALNSCSHITNGLPHHIKTVDLKKISPCSCRMKASETVGKWALALQG